MKNLLVLIKMAKEVVKEHLRPPNINLSVISKITGLYWKQE